MKVPSLGHACQAFVCVLPCILMLAVPAGADPDRDTSFETAMQVRQPFDPQVRQKLQKLRTLVIETQRNGGDVSRAVMLGRQGREAAARGDQNKAKRLLDQALALLSDSGVVATQPTESQYQQAPAQLGPEKTIDFPVRTDSVFVTRSVPGASRGAAVTRADRAFPAETMQASRGKVSLRLSSIPIYVEERESGGSSDPRITSGVIDNSPFGGDPPASTPAFEKEYANVGVKWIRYAGRFMAWGTIEREEGRFNWSIPDRLVSQTLENGARVMFTVKSTNPRDQGVSRTQSGQRSKPKAPKNTVAFLRFLAKAVERYDGDGKDDAPGSPVVTHWQIENEVDGHFWGDTAENYARLLKSSYKTIKRANPNAQVLIAGAASNRGFHEFYTQIMRALDDIRDAPGERYFDILDFHWYGNAGDYKSVFREDLTDFIRAIESTFAKHGYHDIPIWITETGTHGGPNVQSQGGRALPQQDETTQAAELVRRYAYFIGNGIQKVFWTQMLENHHRAGGQGSSNDYFENIGLINNPANDGDSSKKLGYYAYQELIRKLEGSDWAATEELNLGAGVYAYRFTRNGDRISVLWYDP